MIVSLIASASRGLGLQYSRHILTQYPGSLLYAGSRNPDEAVHLKTLQDQFGSNRLKVVKMDVTKEEHLQSVAHDIKKDHGSLDLLINCAAMLHPSGRGETSLKQVRAEDVEATLRLNCISPLMVVKHFQPLLQNRQCQFPHGEKEAGVAGIVVNMSAKVGSITDNGLGGWYSYRMSKAALNMATKNLSIELGRGKKKIICVSLHPGTVDTDLSRPYHKNVAAEKLFSTEYSVNCLMSIIENLTVEQSGNFFSWDGTQLPF